MVEVLGVSPKSEAGMVFTTSVGLWEGIQRLLHLLLAPSTFDDFLVLHECRSQEVGVDGSLVSVLLSAMEREGGLVEQVARELGLAGDELQGEVRRWVRFLAASGGVVIREPSRGL